MKVILPFLAAILFVVVFASIITMIGDVLRNEKTVVTQDKTVIIRHDFPFGNTEYKRSTKENLETVFQFRLFRQSKCIQAKNGSVFHVHKIGKYSLGLKSDGSITRLEDGIFEEGLEFNDYANEFREGQMIIESTKKRFGVN